MANFAHMETDSEPLWVHLDNGGESKMATNEKQRIQQLMKFVEYKYDGNPYQYGETCEFCGTHGKHMDDCLWLKASVLLVLLRKEGYVAEDYEIGG